MKTTTTTTNQVTAQLINQLCKAGEIKPTK